MKLLIIGSYLEYGIDAYYFKHLKEYFDVVELFPAQDFFNNYYQKNIVNKILCRIGYQYIYSEINNKCKVEVARFKPNVILVFKGMELYPTTLKWIKQRNIAIVNYNADHPFYYHGFGSGNKNVRVGFAFYDMHISYSQAILDEIKKKHFSMSTRLIPFGYEIEDDMYEIIKDEHEILEPCFIGTPDGNRVKIILYLLNKQIPITVIGYWWDRFLKPHPLLTIKPPMLNQDLWKSLRKYRVQINIFRPHNEGSHNMRSFEIPAAGGIQLAPWSKEHLLYFELNKEIFLYKTLEELANKIKEILLLPPDEVNFLRKAARKRSVNSEYSYRNRAIQMANALYEIATKKCE